MVTPYQAWVIEKRPILSRLPGVRSHLRKNPRADYLSSFWDKFLIEHKTYIDNLFTKNLDPDLCDSEYLDYLGFLNGFSANYWDRNWHDQAKRNLIRNGYPIIWKYFGTAVSLSTVLTCFGIENQVVTINDFQVGISEVGDRIGDLAWIYEIRVPEAYKNTETINLIEQLNTLFGVGYCEKFIVFLPKPETILSSSASSFQTRLTTSGYTPPIKDIQIIDQYYLRPIRNSSLRNKIQLANIYYGVGNVAHRVPLIGDVNATVVATDTYSTTRGYQSSNGNFVNTNKTPDSLGINNEDLHFSVYGENLYGSGVEALVSSHNGSNWQILYSESPTVAVFSSQLSPAYAVRGNTADLAPFVIGQNSGRSNTVLFGNGERKAYFPNGNAGSKMTASSVQSSAFILEGAHDTTGGGVTGLYSNALLQSVTVGKALSKSEAKLLYEITSALNIKLNRSSENRELKKFVVLSPEHNQGIQRDRFKNVADIEIEILYREYKVTRLFAQYGDNDPQLIALLTTPGSYKGTLKKQPTGQETLKLWLENEPNNIQIINNVTIGDGFVVVGQSNAEGVFLEPYIPTGLQYEICLHNHVGGWQAYTDPSSPTTGAGSVWGMLGERLINRYKVPVFFVCLALGGTGLVNGHWDRTVGFCYEQMIYTLKQTGLKNVTAFLMQLGENDAFYGVPANVHRDTLLQFPVWLNTDLGYSISPIVIAAQIGLFNAATEANVNAIREAERQAWNAGTNLKAGFPTFFRNLAANDGAHWQTNDDRIVLSKLWERIIGHWCYGALEGRAPRFLSAVTVGNVVTINVQDGYGVLTPGSNPEIGWLAADNIGAMTPTNVQVINRQIILTFPRNLGSPAYVSFATGFFGTGNTIRDSGLITQYPLEPLQEQVN